MLYLVKRYGRYARCVKFKQTAQRVRAALVIHHCGIFLKTRIRAELCSLAQRYHRFGAVHMVFFLIAGT